MKKTVILAGVLLISNLILASDKSEAGIPTTPLKIYSGGICIGAARSQNDEMKNDIGKNQLTLAFSSLLSVRSNIDFFLDATLLQPENSYGADFGTDFIFSESDFRPFAGIGVGGYVMNHSGEFSNDFGPAVTMHVGFTMDINENVAVRLRAPFRMILNEYDDQMAGLDLTFLFSSKFKNVKKLNYN